MEHFYEDLLEMLNEAFDCIGMTYYQALNDKNGTYLDCKSRAWMSPQVITSLMMHVVDNLVVLCGCTNEDFEIDKFNDWVRINGALGEEKY